MEHLKTFETFQDAPVEIKNKLEELIEKLLAKYKGGRPFFDALDDQIKNSLNEDITISLMKGCENKYICSSGGFGDKVHKLWKEGKIKCKGLIIFNGKIMTKDKGVTYWYPADFDIKDKEFVFVDDSLFSGKTFRVIEDFLKGYNSTIEYVSVVYDGSKRKDERIHSFYRYYD